MTPVSLKRIAGCVSILLTGWFIGTAQADTSSALLAQGYKQWAAGHMDQAQRSYEQAAKRGPRSLEAHTRLAGLYIARNNFSASIKEYQNVISLDPKNAKAFIGLGIAYLHSGNKSLTRAAWEEAVRLEPAREPQLTPLLAKLDSPTP